MYSIYSQAASFYLRFRCSNSKLRILEQAVKYIQSCKKKHQNINFEHTFHFEHICPYTFDIDFEHINPAKNRTAQKITLFMRTSTRGHLLARAGFVSKSLSENSGRHQTNNIIDTSHAVKLTNQQQKGKKRWKVFNKLRLFYPNNK